MKTIRQVLEEIENDNADMNKKMQQVSLYSDNLRKQIIELNNMWKKKSIDDMEYRKKMEELNKQLELQRQQAEKNRIAQNAVSRGVNQPEEPVI
jgi:chromosome segregation ATPase